MVNNKVIGLVGGIACGKSTISKFLMNNGAYWIEADNLAHEALRRISVLKHLHNHWRISHPNIIKEEWLDNSYDDCISLCLTKLERKKLSSDVAAVVFSDERELRFLETLVHPIVSNQIKNIIESRKGVIILDAPLLLETGLDKLCDFIWFIKLSFSKRLENFSKRYPNESSSDILDNLIKREKCQMALNEKIRMSDIVLNNNDNIFSVLEKWMSGNPLFS